MNRQSDRIYKVLEKENIEIWLDVVGYEGHYKVSNLGRVKRIAREIVLDDTIVNLKEMILNPFDSDKGNGRIYKRMKLVGKDGIIKNKYLHIMVAEAFIENYDVRLNVVNHIDNNRENNKVSNLEWCTQAHNMREYYRLHKKK